METSSIGLGDAMLLAQRNNGYNDGGMNGMWNNPFVYLIWLAFFGGFGNGGFGGFGNGGNNAAAQGALTRAELYAGLDNQDVKADLRGISSQLADNRYAQQECCCTTQRAIDAVRFDNAQNTCAITTNATANTQHILDKLCQMEANAKDAEIANLRDRLTVANLQISQQVQNATIISAVRPTPIPAYPAASPYCGIGYGGFGYGGGNCYNA